MTAPIPFAGSELDQTRHVSAFFNSADEEYRVLLPWGCWERTRLDRGLISGVARSPVWPLFRAVS
jgi:hypothetical protein